jgi:hypothetical protein
VKSGNCVASRQDGVAESEINMQSLRDGAVKRSVPSQKANLCFAAVIVGKN